MKAKKYWSCARKKRYLKGQAFMIAEKRNLYKGWNDTAYECEFCGWWHVTKRPQKWPLDKLKSKGE